MKRIFLAGHRGMVGSAIHRKLRAQPNLEILTKTRDELDLSDQRAVYDFMKFEKPDEVILAAAKVGGIYANDTYPADFIYENLQIQNNVISASHLTNVQKLLFLGSSCIYPRDIKQPITEDALLKGALEPTNESYAIAKIAGIKMCESFNRQYGRDYRSVMPTNLYGPGDNYHPENSHVVAGLIRRFHEANEQNRREVIVWGTGSPRREFLHVDDMAEASLFVHNLDRITFAKITKTTLSHVNVGTGVDVTIRQLAETVKKIVGFKGDLIFDRSKPDGTSRKLLDVQKLRSLGWSSKIPLNEGLKMTYEVFRQSTNTAD